MNTIRMAVLPLAVSLVATANSMAAAPTRPANPYNVPRAVATVSPINPALVKELRERRTLKLLIVLQHITQQNIERLNHLIEEASDKIDDLKNELDQDGLDDDDRANLEERLKSKEEKLGKLAELLALFQGKSSQFAKDIASLK